MKKISLLTFGLSVSLATIAQEKPNIVYILTDDLGYGNLKCLNPNSRIPTTNMDRLSKQSVIFTSDNGADWKAGDKVAFPKHDANYTFKSEKSDIWDGGHHIPFLVRWPKGAKKGTINEALIGLTDFFSTCVEFTLQFVEPGAGEYILQYVICNQWNIDN